MIVYRSANEERNLYYPNENYFNDLIGDFSLPKSNVELLTSRLKQRNLLNESQVRESVTIVFQAFQPSR